MARSESPSRCSPPPQPHQPQPSSVTPPPAQPVTIGHHLSSSGALASPVRLDHKIPSSPLPLSAPFSPFSPDSVLTQDYGAYHYSPTPPFPPAMGSPATYPLPHSPLNYPYLPHSYYHSYNVPYSPSSTHSRQLSNPASLSSLPPPLSIQPTPAYSSPGNQNPLATPTYASAPYYHHPTPPAPLNYPQSNQPAYHPPQPIPAQPPSSHPPNFSPCSPNFHSPPPPPPPAAIDQTTFYPNWQEPYSCSSPSYEPAYQPVNIPYLAFRDQQTISPRGNDSAYNTLAFSPTHSNLQESYQRTYREHHAHPSPLQSPFTSPGPHTPHTSFRSPQGGRHHHHHHHPSSPRYGAFVNHRGPFSSGSSPPIHHHGPKSPTTSPPVSSESLVRGSLAQAKLRNHHLVKRHHQPQPMHQPITSLNMTKSSKPVPHLQRPALPRPPSHSEHALWVGNVPNDASHEELWKFFTARTLSSGPGNPTAGVESIHLISRSNCAFVNYISDEHLQYAIEVCNGKSLRQFDPRCKNLVCRVRKVEDNVKSGVGAQRIGGMHRSWIKKINPSFVVKEKEKEKIEKQGGGEGGEDEGFKRTGSTSTCNSNEAGSGSTTSSFLSKHFSTRYFILKSYTEDDLKLSIERQVWASQSHNEPILDQAYRTSPKGVYLIFSVNRSGEFYGYARMTGPIWRPIARPASVPNSPVSRPSLVLGSGRRASVSGSLEHEHEVLAGLEDASGVGNRVTTASPSPLSPRVGTGAGGGTGGLGIPLLPVHNARSLPEPIRKDDINQEEVGEEGSEADSAFGNNGRPFEVEWIKVQRLPFHLTRDLKNPFNGHREVKVSRDGTEIEPVVGAELLARIDSASLSLGGGLNVSGIVH